MANAKVETAVTAVRDMVNTFGNTAPDFIEGMRKEHRTLQNSFTKLCLEWLEFVGSENYRYDARNESSHNVCEELLTAFRDRMKAKGYTEATLDLMAKPSSYCAMI